MGLLIVFAWCDGVCGLLVALPVVGFWVWHIGAWGLVLDLALVSYWG